LPDGGTAKMIALMALVRRSGLSLVSYAPLAAMFVAAKWPTGWSGTELAVPLPQVPERYDLVSVEMSSRSRFVFRSPAANRCGRWGGPEALSNAGTASRGWAANQAA
jgi:hypothetical protein